MCICERVCVCTRVSAHMHEGQESHVGMGLHDHKVILTDEPLLTPSLNFFLIVKFDVLQARQN